MPGVTRSVSQGYRLCITSPPVLNKSQGEKASSKDVRAHLLDAAYERITTDASRHSKACLQHVSGMQRVVSLKSCY